MFWIQWPRIHSRRHCLPFVLQDEKSASASGGTHTGLFRTIFPQILGVFQGARKPTRIYSHYFCHENNYLGNKVILGFSINPGMIKLLVSYVVMLFGLKDTALSSFVFPFYTQTLVKMCKLVRSLSTHQMTRIRNVHSLL